MKDEGELVEERIVRRIQEIHIYKGVRAGSGEVGVLPNGTIAIRTFDFSGEGDLWTIGSQSEMTPELAASFKPILRGLNKNILDEVMQKNLQSITAEAAPDLTAGEISSADSVENASESGSDTETEEAEEPSAERAGQARLNTILQEYANLL